MKVIAINGSPNPNGNTQTIVNSILKGMASNGHQSQVFHLNQMNIKDCLGCKNANQIHKEKDCIHDDDFREILLPAIREADLIILGSPVYMGHITGSMKTMFDRFYTFVMGNFAIRDLENKKFISVVTSGAPAESFQYVSDYLKNWLGEYFFKMECVATIHEGDFTGESGECVKQEMLEDYEKLGKSIR